MTSRHTIALLTGLVLLASASGSEPAEPELTFTQTTVPEGFEDLLAPRTSLVDVYVGGRLLTTASATFTPDVIEFTQPEHLVRLLPDVLNPDVIVMALRRQLVTHADKLCHQQSYLQEPGEQCGVIYPETVGVIFNEARFRADLFIHPDYLPVKEALHDKYLPDATAGLGVMQDVTVNVSGNFNGKTEFNNYTLFGNTSASAWENHVQANWDISRDRSFSVNQLLLERDYRGHQWQAGLTYGSGFGLNFTSSSRFWGVSLASSFNTRTDRSLSQGTPLDIFMPVRGRYEMLYEERLIDSGFLEAGSQAINTSHFPGGAYDLVIRLFDEQGGLIREESRFFAKQSRLPPLDDPEYFIEAGRVADTDAISSLPKITDTYLFRAGIHYRLLSTLAGTFALATTPGQTLGESTLFTLGRRYELSGSLMFGGMDNIGVRLDARYRLQALQLSADYTRLWRDQDKHTPSYELLSDAFRQMSFSANVPILKGSASYRYSLSERPGYQQQTVLRPLNRFSLHQQVIRKTVNSKQVQQTLSYSCPVYRDSRYLSLVRFDVSWTEDGSVTGLISVELRYSERNWMIRLTPQSDYARTSQNGSQTTGSLRAGGSYSGQDTLLGTLNASMDGQASAGRFLSSVSTQFGSTWGSGHVHLNHVSDHGLSNTSYSASLNTSLAANNSVLAVGGGNQGNSAVVVTVKGASVSDRFHVYINNHHQGNATGGKATVIPLSSFNTYQVRIRPGQVGALFSFDEKQHEVTLYPGNIATLDFDVTRIRVVFGRLRTPDGAWLKHASMSGGPGLTTTDEYGLFQLEVPDNVSELTVTKQGEACSVSLPSEAKTDVINLGVVECQAKTSPEAASKRPR